jgi:hypothetical protein
MTQCNTQSGKERRLRRVTQQLPSMTRAQWSEVGESDKAMAELEKLNTEVARAKARLEEYEHWCDWHRSSLKRAEAEDCLEPEPELPLYSYSTALADLVLQTSIYKLVERLPGTETWTDMETSLRGTWHKRESYEFIRLDRVCEIQHESLKQRYREYKSSRGRECGELKLYHGCGQAPQCDGFEKSCQQPGCPLCNICKEGFLKRFWGKHRWQRYGPGFYFALQASKSHEYPLEIMQKVPPGRHKRVMLLCKVAIGKQFTTTKDIADLDGDAPAGYDSVYGQGTKGGSLNYDELAVYKEAAILPYALVRYEYVKHGNSATGSNPELDLVLPSQVIVTYTIFASMRFVGGKALPEALQLRDALAGHGINLLIIELSAGTDISKAVFEGIEKSDAFLVFGTDTYGEDTGNPACTYHELNYARSIHKRIIALRMIPWDKVYAELAARVFFSQNNLVLSWMSGDPMPGDLVSSIAEALAPGPGAQATTGPVASLSDLAHACNINEQTIIGYSQDDVEKLFQQYHIGFVEKQLLCKEIDLQRQKQQALAKEQAKAKEKARLAAQAQAKVDAAARAKLDAEAAARAQSEAKANAIARQSQRKNASISELAKAEDMLRQARDQLHTAIDSVHTHVCFMVKLSIGHFPLLLSEIVQQVMGCNRLFVHSKRLSDYDVDREALHRGRHTYFTGTHRQQGGTVVCLKKLELPDDTAIILAVNDIRSVQQLHITGHGGGIISYDAIFIDNNNIYVEMPFHVDGSLKEWLSSSPSISARRNALRQVLSAMSQLHSKECDMIHGDIRGENVLITSDGTPVLHNFEASLPSGFPHQVKPGCTGFLAPEWQREGQCLASRATDMYAFGVLVLNTIHPPREDKYPINTKSAAAAVINDPALKPVVNKLLDADPDRRPSAIKLQLDPYFAIAELDEWGRVDVGGYTSGKTCRQELLDANPSALKIERVRDVVAEVDRRIVANGIDPSNNAQFAMFFYTMQSQYCKSGQQPFAVLNNALRQRGGPHFDAWRPFLWHLMQALNALPDKKCTVFRGMKNCPVQDYKQGKTVHWSGFSSSSTLPNVATGFAGRSGVVFKLHVNNAKDIQPFSWFGAAEGELLLSPNMVRAPCHHARALGGGGRRGEREKCGKFGRETVLTVATVRCRNLW